MKNVGICLRPQGYQRPPDVVRSRSYDPAHEPPGGPDGDGEARGRGIAADRGGGRLVRVSRGDPQPVGDPLPRARAVGLGPPDAADAGDQDPARKAPPSRGGVTERWSRGAASSRRIAASPSARVPAYATTPFTAHPATGTRSSSSPARARIPKPAPRVAAISGSRSRGSISSPYACSSRS